MPILGEMDIGSWSSAIVVAVIGASATVAQGRRKAGARDQIKSDIEIYKSLPRDSTVGAKLLARIDTQIESLIENEQQLTRDKSGLVLAIVLLVAGGWTTYVVVSAGGAWRWFLAGTLLLAIVGIAGFVESIGKAKRDEKGNKIKS